MDAVSKMLMMERKKEDEFLELVKENDKEHVYDDIMNKVDELNEYVKKRCKKCDSSVSTMFLRLCARRLERCQFMNIDFGTSCIEVDEKE